MNIKSISVSNFRSIVEEIKIPVGGKTTLLVGPNNSGKSNILRFLTILYNKAFDKIDDELDFSTGKPKTVNCRIELPGSSIAELSGRLTHLKNYLHGGFETKSFNVEAKIDRKNFLANSTSGLDSIISQKYFTDNFRNDFSQSGNAEDNIAFFLQNLNWQSELSGTVFVPSLRLIPTPGNSVPHFGRIDQPGITVSSAQIVSQLLAMGNPSGPAESRVLSGQRLNKICSFVAYCIEKSSVEIKAPYDSSTIYVKIDGNEQPISNLGSGIEQLIMIGVASYEFSNKLILINEPELHFHPRTQKRMMRYLQDSLDNKFVVATHSAAILDSIEADIVQVSSDETECRARIVSNKQDRYQAVRDLGHSPSELVQSNYVIWVEGPSDRVYLNFWISVIDPELIEGIDYSIIFYGGSVLSQYSFSDEDENLVKAISICREFAVYADSDKESEDSELKGRVMRVMSEVSTKNGFGWVSYGREIENYLPTSVLTELSQLRKGIMDRSTDFTKILDQSAAKDKVSIAREAVKIWQKKELIDTSNWPFDLESKVTELVKRIVAAR